MRLVVEKIPLFVLAAASCVVTLAAQRDAMQPLEQLAFPWRVANAAVAYVAYLGKMLYPAGLAVLYPLPKGPPPAWEVVAAVAVLLAISTAVFAARRKCPYLLFGWLWYLGTLVPVIGLVQVGSQAMADRYTYLTQIGLYVAFAWGAAHVAGSWPSRRRALAAVAALVVAGLMACAWQQTRYWRDSETLWTHTLACTPQNPIAHNNLGLALAGRGQVDEAIAHYRKALEIKPDYAEAHNNLGNALAGRGQIDEAIAHYRKALEIKPDYAKAHYNLGMALAGRGQVDEAIDHYRQGRGNQARLRGGPQQPRQRVGRPRTGRRGDRPLPEGPGNQARLRDRPQQPRQRAGRPRTGRARRSPITGRPWKSSPTTPRPTTTWETRWPAAGTSTRRSPITAKHWKSSPTTRSPTNNLASALVGRGQVDEAIAHYRKALEIKPDYLEAHYNLGLALAGRGQLDEAIKHYRTALRLATARNDRALADAIRAQIRLHQSIAPAGKAL